MILGSNWALLVFSIKLLINFTSSQTVSCKLPNTGTVLFRKSDIRRLDCWSQEEIALLYSRRIFQEVLPKQIPRNVPRILEYFKLCLFAMKDVVTSEYTFSMMLLVFSDVFGGFLKAFGLPLINEAYYEGYVDYTNTKKLYNAQHDFVQVLRTDGEQWAQRMEIRKQINKVLPLTLSTNTDGQACSKIITEDKISHVKKRDIEIKAQENFTSSFIPLPLLDNAKEPSTIAVPLKEHSLYSLLHQCSYDILLTYYTTASDCIEELSREGGHKVDQSVFDQTFHTWLKNNVLPHLTDETWYIGFSNVLRIEATIVGKDGILGTRQSESIHDESKIESMLTALQEESKFNISTASSLLLVAILILSLCIICFLYWAFFKHFMCCCTTIKCDVEGSPNSYDSSSTASLLTSGTTSKISSSLDDSQTSKKKYCKHKSKSDSKMGSPKSSMDVNQCNSMPSLQMVISVDEDRYFSQQNRPFESTSSSSNRKKREKRSKSKRCF